MSIELYPTKIEGYENGEPMFKVEAFDEDTASISIDAVVSMKNYKELFASIEKALKILRLGDSK